MTKDEAQELCQGGPQRGQIYRHYKGGLYTVLARAVKEDTLEQLVVYQSNRKGGVWVRSLENFTEKVEVDPGHWRHRFAREVE